MVPKLLYRGPSITELHERYAKRGVVDQHASVRAVSESTIDAPLARVWQLMIEVDRWSWWNPALRDISVDGPVAVDMTFAWTNSNARIRSRFAVVDPPRELSWTGLFLGAKAVHRNTLSGADDGPIVVRTEESLSMPLLSLMYSSDKLRESLDAWLAALKQAAE